MLLIGINYSDVVLCTGKILILSIRYLFKISIFSQHSLPDFSECNLSAVSARNSRKVKEDNASKILNAPGAAKNFYYNLVDWGANNIVVIGLKEDVYYWDAAKC